VIERAGEAALPLTPPPDASDQPSDESLRELYSNGPGDLKRRTFSFLRG
jgi:hypothetical protein